MQLSMFMPASDWSPPQDLPDLRGQANVAIDLETKDDGLAAGRGSGWARNAVQVAGMGVAWGEPGRVQGQYFPIRHPGSNFSSTQVGDWLRDHLACGDVTFHFHNGPYDLGCMRAEWGLTPPARIQDTTAKAVLVNENRPSYKLDAVCRAYGLEGKDEVLLREAAAAMGIKPGQVKASMWRMDAKYVGPYGEADPVQTLELSYKLEREIEDQGLGPAYQLEMDLIPMIQEMRWRGMRVDTDAAEQAVIDLRGQRDEVLADLSHRLARRVTVDMCRSPQFLEYWHDAEGIPYPRTPRTRRGSFTADWMRTHEHWLPRLVARAEQLEEAASKFVEGFVLGYAHRGRLHADINQFRSDEGGTRTHRFSYSDPALQQMPGDKQPELKRLVRGLFLPEPGERWGALDYSQQEYRLIVHYACRLGLPGAREARERYLADPRTDFHQMVADMTGLPRRNAKDVNFAKVYGAGTKQFAYMTGMSEAKAAETMEQYDKQLPFPRALDAECRTVARRSGYVIMVDGARMHFDRWEPAEWEARDGSPPLAIHAARKRWPGQRLVRAFTHKAMNGLIQGGAARQTKSAMRDCWREGLVPLIQMHDELSFSFDEHRDALRAAELMRETIHLEVPMLVDAEFGPNWGDAKHTWEEAA